MSDSYQELFGVARPTDFKKSFSKPHKTPPWQTKGKLSPAPNQQQTEKSPANTNKNNFDLSAFCEQVGFKPEQPPASPEDLGTDPYEEAMDNLRRSAKSYQELSENTDLSPESRQFLKEAIGDLARTRLEKSPLFNRPLKRYR